MFGVFLSSALPHVQVGQDMEMLTRMLTCVFFSVVCLRARQPCTSLPVTVLSVAICLPVQCAPIAFPGPGECWEIGVMVGPHSAPDYFTEPAMEALFNAVWGVHHQSNRLGVRLLGPLATVRSRTHEYLPHDSAFHSC